MKHTAILTEQHLKNKCINSTMQSSKTIPEILLSSVTKWSTGGTKINLDTGWGSWFHRSQYIFQRKKLIVKLKQNIHQNRAQLWLTQYMIYYMYMYQTSHYTEPWTAVAGSRFTNNFRKLSNLTDCNVQTSYTCLFFHLL